MAGKALVVKKDELQVSEAQTGELETTAAASREIAEVQAAVILARKFPRDEERTYSKLLRSCGRVSFAEDASYSFPRGGTTVSGPSVNIAREAARLWGNVRFGLNIIRDDEDARGIRAWAWDMESNAKVSYDDEFKKLVYRKPNPTTGFPGGWITPDERDLRELTNRRGAICLRNCLLQLIPKDFIEDALAECKKTLTGQAKTGKATILPKIAASFAEFRVSEADLGVYLGHPLADASDDEIVTLRGIYKALTDGIAKKEEYFGSGKAAGPETGTLKMGDLKAGTESEHQGHDAPGLVTVESLKAGISLAETAKLIDKVFVDHYERITTFTAGERAEIENAMRARKAELKAGK